MWAAVLAAGVLPVSPRRRCSSGADDKAETVHDASPRRQRIRDMRRLKSARWMLVGIRQLLPTVPLVTAQWQRVTNRAGEEAYRRNAIQGLITGENSAEVTAPWSVLPG